MQVSPVLEQALETILVLHFDHEQNASTSTVRTAGELLATVGNCLENCIWARLMAGRKELACPMYEAQAVAGLPSSAHL